MSLSLVGFSNSRDFVLAFLCLLMVGAARRGIIISSQTLVQMNTENAYRGRMMAMYLMTIGFMPLGTIPAGAMADAWGVPVTLMLQGTLMAAIFIVFWGDASLFRNAKQCGNTAIYHHINGLPVAGFCGGVEQVACECMVDSHPATELLGFGGWLPTAKSLF